MVPKMKINLKARPTTSETASKSPKTESQEDRERERSVERKPKDYRNHIDSDRKESKLEIKGDDTIIKSNTIEETRGRSKERQNMEEEEVVEGEADDSMFAMMGFGGFGSTKNKKVEGTDCYGVRKKQKTTYRQYMNRDKGFNRPLSPPRKAKK